jgi:hypothetical protein
MSSASKSSQMINVHNALCAKYDEKKKEIEKLESENRVTQGHIDELEKKSAISLNNYENLQSRIIALKKKIADESTNLNKLKKEIADEAKYLNTSPNFNTRSVKKLEKRIVELNSNLLETKKGEQVPSQKNELADFIKERNSRTILVEKLKAEISEMAEKLKTMKIKIKTHEEQCANINKVFEWQDKYLEYADKYGLCREIVEEYLDERSEPIFAPSNEKKVCDCGCNYITHAPFYFNDSNLGDTLHDYRRLDKGDFLMVDMSEKEFDKLYGVEDYEEIKGSDEEEFDEDLEDLLVLIASCNSHHNIVLQQSYKYPCRCYKQNYHGSDENKKCKNDHYYVIGNGGCCSNNVRVSLEYEKNEIKEMIRNVGFIEEIHPIGGSAEYSP